MYIYIYIHVYILIYFSALYKYLEGLFVDAPKTYESLDANLTHVLVTQFYDHFFDWGLKDEIKSLIDVRKRNGINAAATIQIAVAEDDLYIATMNDKVIVKLGTRQDLGELTPGEDF